MFTIQLTLEQYEDLLSYLQDAQSHISEYCGTPIYCEQLEQQIISQVEPQFIQKQTQVKESYGRDSSNLSQ